MTTKINYFRDVENIPVPHIESTIEKAPLYLWGFWWKSTADAPTQYVYVTAYDNGTARRIASKFLNGLYDYDRAPCSCERANDQAEPMKIYGENYAPYLTL